MRNVRKDRGINDRIIAATVATFVGMMTSGIAIAQTGPARTPADLAIEAAVPMPETANVPPISASDFTALARGLASGEPAKSDAAPAAAASTTVATAPAGAPVKAEISQEEPAKTGSVTPAESTTVPVPVPAVAQPAPTAEPATAAPAAADQPAPQASAVASADQAVADRLRDLFATKSTRFFDRKAERAAAETFYKDRNYAPLWSQDNAATARARAAIARLNKADADGLDAADYPAPNFGPATSPDALAEADLRLTATLLDFARHAQGGRMHPSRISGDIAYPENNPDPAAVLKTLATASDVAAALDAFNPQHKGFKALRVKLAELRGSTDAPVARIEEGQTLRFAKATKKKPATVMDDPRVPDLRARLGISENRDSQQYDEAVAAAVRKFQASADLKATGVLDNATVRALNSPKRDRMIDLVRINMERWRWLPRNLGEPKLGNAYVMLNIPDFTLKVVQNGAQVWNTRVVVGKPGKQATPELTETMKYITVNPTWNVPPSIVYGEYLPALQQDPTVMQRMGMKVIQNRDGSIHIQQPPGAGNALGRIRFNFPNKFLVYQHDTPDKHLFAHESRAYSHGCMRVQNPDQYAEVLLGITMPGQNYSAARIRGMYGNSEIDLRFPTPLPVHIVYHTAFVDDAGHLQTRKDIYGRDQLMIAALIRSNDRQNLEMAVSRPQPSYARPRATLPSGVPGATQTQATSSGRGFFETLFGAPQPPPPQRSQRRSAERQASR